jgi:hypothetical protein
VRERQGVTHRIQPLAIAGACVASRRCTVRGGGVNACAARASVRKPCRFSNGTRPHVCGERLVLREAVEFKWRFSAASGTRLGARDILRREVLHGQSWAGFSCSPDVPRCRAVIQDLECAERRAREVDTTCCTDCSPSSYKLVARVVRPTPITAGWRVWVSVTEACRPGALSARSVSRDDAGRFVLRLPAAPTSRDGAERVLARLLH